MAVTNVLDCGHEDGHSYGKSTTSKLAFYGITPIVQRSGASQATSLLSTASSTAIDTLTKAAIIEIMNTLTAVGLWKGAA
jgi:predicted transposase YdaD